MRHELISWYPKDVKMYKYVFGKIKSNPEIADLLNGSEKSNKFMSDWDIYKSIDRNI